jgi:hypothetical protein
MVQVENEISDSLLKIAVPSDIYVADFKEKVQEKYKKLFLKEIAAGLMKHLHHNHKCNNYRNNFLVSKNFIHIQIFLFYF